MRVYQVIWLEVVMRLLTENIPKNLYQMKSSPNLINLVSGQWNLITHGIGEKKTS